METGNRETEGEWFRGLPEAEREKFNVLLNTPENELDFSDMTQIEIADALRHIDNLEIMESERLQNTKEAILKGLIQERIGILHRKRNRLEQEALSQHLKEQERNKS